tara:strand:- start:333 stop:908 length:576 start_codon:yes stop_codon:yes gene_type:complete
MHLVQKVTAVPPQTAGLSTARPYELGLAEPMPIMTATGRGAQAGVFIKRAEALKHFEKVDSLAVGKTETLTEGKPRLVAVLLTKDHAKAGVLPLASSLVRASEQPLVKGKGVKGVVAGKKVAFGNRASITGMNVEVGGLIDKFKLRRDAVATTMLEGLDGVIVGLVSPMIAAFQMSTSVVQNASRLSQLKT